jgi:antitoxin CcdA
MAGTRQADETIKRPINVTLTTRLVEEARSLGINVSRACEDGLEAALRVERAHRWQQANTAGFDAWNDYVEKHGVPLANHRKF